MAASDENSYAQSKDGETDQRVLCYNSIQNKIETVTDFIFLSSKSLQMVIAAMKLNLNSCLLLRRKAMTNLDSILKSRDVTLLTKVHLVKAIFPVVMYGCESWIKNEAEY